MIYQIKIFVYICWSR